MIPMTTRRNAPWAGRGGPGDVFGDELERLFNRWWGGDGGNLPAATAAYPVDIREDDSHVYVEAELPGFRKEEVDVRLEGGMLTIVAEHGEQPKEKGERHLSERTSSRVERSFTLPTQVDENNVDAKLEDGVLHLTLNKSEQVKPRKIEVK